MRTWEAYGRVQSSLEDDGSPRITSIYEHESAMRMCGYKPGEYSKLAVVEDPDGIYLGWVASGNEGRISMILHRDLFHIQFPYGYKSEEERGNGQAVRVRLDIVESN